MVLHPSQNYRFVSAFSSYISFTTQLILYVNVYSPAVMTMSRTKTVTVVERFLRDGAIG
jgi:hypothetical protein